ncbi:DMT family transporter [Nioella sp.]|uniref:DMT family transporter n=1 Tax=Nioella sp. TaxID=1912091 RepID=UPI003B52BE08
MDLRAIGMGLAFALIWSSAFSSARIIVAAAPPLTALAIRFAISGAIGVLIARALGQNWQLSRAQWRSVIIFGICQNALYLGLNFVAMQWIEASLAAIIASSMPLIVAAANWAIFREKLPVMGVVGLMAGFGGVALIMAQRLTGGVDPLGVALCIVGAIALAVATLTVTGASSGKSSGASVLMIVGLQMLVGGAALVPFALVMESWVVDWSWQLIVAFIYTCFAPGLLATWIWFLLVQRIGATRGATFHFLNPFFGVAIAAVILGERLGWADILGVTIIAAGILAVQLARAAR